MQQCSSLETKNTDNIGHLGFLFLYNKILQGGHLTWNQGI